MYLKNNLKITTNIFYPPMIIFTLRLDGQIITRMKCVRKKDKTLLLGDIEPFSKEEYINKGYGSILMKHLLKYAKQHKYEKIIGNLSIVDLDHKDRLCHFYEKFGFDIILYDEIQDSYFGKIEKILKY